MRIWVGNPGVEHCSSKPNVGWWKLAKAEVHDYQTIENLSLRVRGGEI
jgi:hypothetical protein